MEIPPEDDDYFVIDLEEWEIWPDGQVDDRLRAASDEIAKHDATILLTAYCTACTGKRQKPLARLFGTSVGRLWRVHDAKGFLIDEIDEPGATIACPVHGADPIDFRRPSASR